VGESREAILLGSTGGECLAGRGGDGGDAGGVGES